MGLWDLINKHSRNVSFKSKAVPFHFEVHGDKYSVEVTSELDKGQVFDLFFKGVKKLRSKTDRGTAEDLPSCFSASKQQLKALESLVVNKRFLEDVLKQVKKDIPSFKIINSVIGKLTWEAIGKDKYLQTIVIEGICYYEE